MPHVWVSEPMRGWLTRWICTPAKGNDSVGHPPRPNAVVAIGQTVTALTWTRFSNSLQTCNALKNL